MISLLSQWNQFFHSRVDHGACRLAGFIRIGFALVMLYDRILLRLDLETFFSPSKGVIPFHIGQTHTNIVSSMWTLFSVSPNSEKLVWILWAAGVVHSLFLVVGVAPRWHLIGLMANLISFHHHNLMVWGPSDVLSRIWCFFLFFFPLDHVTIWDLPSIRGKAARKLTGSWPIWPFRLFQLQLSLVYMGTFCSKVHGVDWWSGRALQSWCEFSDFCSGWLSARPHGMTFVWGEEDYTEMFFQYMTWTVLVLEGSSCTLVWLLPGRGRRLFAIAMIGLQFAAEIFLNLHSFPPLLVLGWSTHFIDPIMAFSASSSYNLAKDVHSLHTKATNLGLSILLLALFMDAFPWSDLAELHSTVFGPDPPFGWVLDAAIEWRYSTFQKWVEPILCLTGLWQDGAWDVFGGRHGTSFPPMTTSRYAAVLYNMDGTEEVWSSPEFEDDGWLRKRSFRSMLYFAKLDDWSSLDAWMELAEHRAGLKRKQSKHRSDNRFSPTVGVEFWHYWRFPMLDEAGRTAVTVVDENGNTLFEQEEGWTSLLKIQYCSDRQSDCSQRAALGECVSDPSKMDRDCPASCESCWYHFLAIGGDGGTFDWCEPDLLHDDYPYRSLQCTHEDSYDDVDVSQPFYIFSYEDEGSQKREYRRATASTHLLYSADGVGLGGVVQSKRPTNATQAASSSYGLERSAVRSI